MRQDGAGAYARPALVRRSEPLDNLGQHPTREIGQVFSPSGADEVISNRHEHRLTGNVDDLTALAQAAAGGDSRAMAGFIRATQQEVRALCAYLVDPEMADDLAQETFLRAFRALSGFRGDSSARTWLLSIARRVCMDELRRRSRRRSQESRMLSHGGWEMSATVDTDEIEVQELLSHLPEDRRTAFVLTQITGLSYQDAADTCGVAVGTIASRVARARADLIEALGLLSARQGGQQTAAKEPGPPAWRRSIRNRLVHGETR
jgi:RNA polymerase sigma-70 factor (ECF subfamily)